MESGKEVLLPDVFQARPFAPQLLILLFTPLLLFCCSTPFSGRKIFGLAFFSQILTKDSESASEKSRIIRHEPVQRLSTDPKSAK
jgi:hypothetical protein